MVSSGAWEGGGGSMGEAGETVGSNTHALNSWRQHPAHRYGKLKEDGLSDGKTDHRAAKVALEEAVKKGHTRAKVHLASLLKWGEGVVRDKSRADQLGREAFGEVKRDAEAHK